MKKSKIKITKKRNKNATIRGSFFAIFKKTVATALIFSIMITTSLSLSGCETTKKQSKTSVYSFGEIFLTTYNLSEADFEKTYSQITQIARDFENVVSLSNPESELSKANVGSQIELSAGLAEQIKTAITYNKTTYGAFNILLAPIVAKWGFLPGEENYLVGEIPTQESLEELRDLTDISQISLENNTLKKPENVTIDLGGISKGYMADKMREVMEKANCDGILTVGGIIVACGDKNGESYNVAITNPFGGNYFAVVPIQNATLVTSGNYERYFEVDGERYCHIISPETLAPTKSDVVSASVLSQNAMQADVFATALMLLEEDEREQLIKENEISAMLIYQNGESETFGDFPTE